MFPGLLGPALLAGRGETHVLRGAAVLSAAFPALGIGFLGVAAAFGPGDHGSTFGGQPLAMAAARATLAVLEQEDAPGRARTAGAHLAGSLARLPGVLSVRGEGLLLAAVLAADVAPAACRAALDAGLIINAPRPNALRFAPSLLVSEAQIDQAIDILAPVLAAQLDVDR